MTSITVFTAIFGYFFLGETLSPIESVGAVMVVIAVLIIYHEVLMRIFYSLVMKIFPSPENRCLMGGFELLQMSNEDEKHVLNGEVNYFSPLCENNDEHSLTNPALLENLVLVNSGDPGQV
jgi:hypothetical protein